MIIKMYHISCDYCEIHDDLPGGKKQTLRIWRKEGWIESATGFHFCSLVCKKAHGKENLLASKIVEDK